MNFFIKGKLVNDAERQQKNLHFVSDYFIAILISDSSYNRV